MKLKKKIAFFNFQNIGSGGSVKRKKNSGLICFPIDVHGCENGWIEHGDRCYYFSREEDIVSWPNALVN